MIKKLFAIACGALLATSKPAYGTDVKQLFHVINVFSVKE